MHKPLTELAFCYLHNATLCYHALATGMIRYPCTTNVLETQIHDNHCVLKVLSNTSSHFRLNECISQGHFRLKLGIAAIWGDTSSKFCREICVSECWYVCVLGLHASEYPPYNKCVWRVDSRAPLSSCVFLNTPSDLSSKMTFPKVVLNQRLLLLWFWVANLPIP